MSEKLKNQIIKAYCNYNAVINQIKTEKHKIIKFNKQHIFFDFLDSLSNELDTGEKIALFYHFNCFQRSLTESRKNNINMSKVWIDYVNKIDTKFSPKTKKGIDALYYRMIAYYKHVNKKYDQAIYNLKMGIMCLTEMENEGIESAFWAKTEQALNIGRAKLASEDYHGMEKTISDLILFIAYGKPFELLDSQASRDILDNASVMKRLSVINNTINSTIGKILRSKEIQKDQKDLTIYRLLSLIRSYDGNNYISKIVGFSESASLIVNIQNNNEAEYIENFNSLLPNLLYVPDQFQYLAFEEFKKLYCKYVDNNDKNFANKLNIYYKNELGIRLD